MKILYDRIEIKLTELLQLVEGSFLGAGQVFAVQDLYCSGLVLFGMLICSPILALAGFFGSLIGTFLGKI
jgi:urea transporter